MQELEKIEWRKYCTSVAVVLKASQSTRGRMLRRKMGLYSISTCSSSASLKWRGKERGEVLHAFTAQVRKLTVRIFMIAVFQALETCLA